eukprot:SAG31_NODE_1352_length_8668_cov_38.573229_1_plen_43_part_00
MLFRLVLNLVREKEHICRPVAHRMRTRTNLVLNLVDDVCTEY